MTTSFKARLAASGAALALATGGVALAAASPASASIQKYDDTQSCNSCLHIQNDYAWRGAIDALHQATAVNSPIGLWYENPGTTDPGADFLQVDAGTVTQNFLTDNDATVNDSTLNWFDYVGDTVVRFLYDPYGDGGANTYLGLDGQLGNGTSMALRDDNPHSRWQEFIEVPVTSSGLPAGCSPSVFSDLTSFDPSVCTPVTSGAAGDTAGVANACGTATGASLAVYSENDPASDSSTATAKDNCVLIDVGQSQNPGDPMVVTDPGDADTGTLVQQVVAFASINQNNEYASNQMWNFED